MNTRDASTLKRIKEAIDNVPKCIRLSAANKCFITDLIKESACSTSQIIQNSVKETQKKHLNDMNNLSEKKILAVIDEKKNRMQVQINTIAETTGIY